MNKNLNDHEKSPSQRNDTEGEDYNIYDNPNDKIDESKIKLIGSLLTTMNMDSEGEYSILDTLSSLNKDDFIELQQLFII